MRHVSRIVKFFVLYYIYYVLPISVNKDVCEIVYSKVDLKNTEDSAAIV